jgi:hypothetical protein
MDVNASRALAKRLFAKFGGQPGVVTRTSTALNVTDVPTSAPVTVRLLGRDASASEAKINAVMTHTPFPAEGCSLRVGNATYDIIEVAQVGVGSDVVTQRVVLHGN